MRALCQRLIIALSVMAVLPAVAGVPALPVMTAVAVSAHTYFVRGEAALGTPANGNFISNAGFVVTRDSVVVIDALGSPALARELLRRIRDITSKPVSHVVLTHYHADHVYGLQVFKQPGVTVIAHRAGRDYLSSETARLRLEASRESLAPWIDANTRLEPADRWVDGDTEFTVGGVTFQIRALGPAHTAEDLAVFVPSEGVLFCGDLVFRGRVPFVGQADSRQWLKSLDRLLMLDARVLLPGHGEPSSRPREDLALTRDYLAYLRKTMGNAARKMEPFDEAYAATDWSPYKSLPLFEQANRMNAYNTYLLMEQQGE